MDNPSFTTDATDQTSTEDSKCSDNRGFQADECDLKQTNKVNEENNKIHNQENNGTLAESNNKTDKTPEASVPIKSPVNLQRQVGLLSGTAMIVGTMIGSGIFVSPKGVLTQAESVGLSLVIWAACGLLSLLGALCYAELGTLITSSGGEYIYFLDGFAPDKSRHTSWWKPIPAFLFAWVSIFLLKPSSLAIITLTCAEYFTRVFAIGVTDYIAPAYAVKLIAAFTICLITFVNCYSVKLATKVQNIFTVAKLIAIAVIIVGGIVMLAKGNTEHLATGFQGSTTQFGRIATGFYSGLWAYDGWNNLNYITEELKNPHKNLPRAIMIGLPLVTICYILVNISYLTVMSTEELLASETVAVLFGQKLIGVTGEVLMVLSVVMSTFGGANGSTFTSARLCFSAAREGHMVDVLSYVHHEKLTPTPAVIFNAFLSLLMIIPSDIGSLIDFFSFTAWIFYGGVMIALILLRFTRKEDHRPYKVPIVIPVLVLIISVYLVIAPIVDLPQIEYLYAGLFILAGLIFYFPFVYFKKSLPFMNKITTFLQMILLVVPTEKEPENL